MAGGASTVALVVAAAEAGGVGFLAGGYKTADALGAEMEAVRAATDGPFGVNLFVPQPPSDPGAAQAYAESLGTGAGEPVWDDDFWDAKAELLVRRPPRLASFTFGCPPPGLTAALRDSGVVVVVTVTTPEEAAIAAAGGAGCLCVQGFEAGAHRGSFTNDDRPDQDWGLLALLGEVSRVTDLPLIAAGGIAGPRGVAAVLAAGAGAAQAGTVFLRCPESGAHPVHRAALADPRFAVTAVTRAFSGRRARGLVNRFMLDHPSAPCAYPEINNATRPLRSAAALRGDAEGMSLWAGQAFRGASERSAGEIVEHLAEGSRSRAP